MRLLRVMRSGSKSKQTVAPGLLTTGANNLDQAFCRPATFPPVRAGSGPTRNARATRATRATGPAGLPVFDFGDPGSTGSEEGLGHDKHHSRGQIEALAIRSRPFGTPPRR